MSERRDDRLDWAFAAALGAGYVVLLLASASSLGYARDEGFYFHAASAYEAWFELLLRDPGAALDRRAVDAAFSVNREHPALIKSLFALSHALFFERLGWFAEEGTSFRFPAMALAGLLLGLVYLWGARAHGRTAGVAAAVLLGAMPRFFYHAHLACFDVPIAAMWVLCAYCYARSLEGRLGWVVATAITFGLALDTKHNSWFLPIAFAVHLGALEVAARWSRRPRPAEVLRGLGSLGAMLVVGPALCVALWPWLWHDTLERVQGYVMFHVRHEFYNMEFLGQTYFEPPMPRSYAWLMTAATVPSVTLVAGLAGALLAVAPTLRGLRARSVEPRDAVTPLLWLLGVLVAYGPWLSTETPIFGGTKHWITAYPFLALFAGILVARVIAGLRSLLVASRRLRRLALGPALEMAVGGAIVAAPIAQTLGSHPFGLSSYVPLFGGAAGAATLGLNRTFWGYTTGSVVEYLNTEVRPSGTVYIHDTALQSWEMLQRDGRLRRDIRAVGSVAGADFALYHHEQHMQGQEYQAWVAFGTTAPAYVAGLDGVPVILVYRRR